jgi:hypothetical protein
MASFIVPPGGFAGFSQQTAAAQRALFPRGASRSRSSGRRRKARKSRGVRASSRRRNGSGRKLKFGSPAWQRKYRVGKFAKRRR